MLYNLFKTTDKKYIPEITQLLQEKNLKCADKNYPDISYVEDMLEDGVVFISTDNTGKIVSAVLGERLIRNGVLIHFAVIRKDMRSYATMSKLFDDLIHLLKYELCEYILAYTAPGIEQIAKRKGFYIGDQYTEVCKILNNVDSK